VDGWEWSQIFAPGAGSWLHQYGHSTNTGVGLVTPSGTQPPSVSFLPNDRVYNWPNPVYGSSTRIRYYTSVPAQVTIKILTIAGELVAELHAFSSGGVDEEVTWDVSGIESGIYLGRLEATGGGKSEVTIIKIAVVK
jgi:hypothetical protein